METKTLLFNEKKRDKMLVELTNVLTLDPGIYDTGWAVWPFLSNQPGDMVYRPSQTGVSHIVRKGNSVRKASNTQCAWLRSVIQIHNINCVIIEQAEVWGGSARSQASATSGDLVKLITLIGRYDQVAAEECSADPVLVTVKEWKGQLSKDAVKQRIRRAIDEEYKSHDADAVGMGLSAQGKL